MIKLLLLIIAFQALIYSFKGKFDQNSEFPLEDQIRVDSKALLNGLFTRVSGRKGQIDVEQYALKFPNEKFTQFLQRADLNQDNKVTRKEYEALVNRLIKSPVNDADMEIAAKRAILVGDKAKKDVCRPRSKIRNFFWRIFRRKQYRQCRELNQEQQKLKQEILASDPQAAVTPEIPDITGRSLQNVVLEKRSYGQYGQRDDITGRGTAIHQKFWQKTQNFLNGEDQSRNDPYGQRPAGYPPTDNSNYGYPSTSQYPAGYPSMGQSTYGQAPYGYPQPVDPSYTYGHPQNDVYQPQKQKGIWRIIVKVLKWILVIIVFIPIYLILLTINAIFNIIAYFFAFEILSACIGGCVDS